MSERDVQFLQLVAMFQMAAMQQLGKIANPVTEKVERDLAQARASIDILEMLQEKTKGNLSEGEAQYLSKVVFELQMNYVDESGKPEGESGDAEEPEAGDTPAPEDSAEPAPGDDPDKGA